MRIEQEEEGEDVYRTAVVDVEAIDEADALVAAVTDAYEGLDELEAVADDTGYLTFEFEHPDGRRLNDDAFFDRVCRYERGRAHTAEFLRAFLEWRDRRRENAGWNAAFSWRNPHKELRPTLLRAAFRLAQADAQYARLYVDFIERTDLEHEADQPNHVDALVEEHGWTPGVRDLLAARLTTARSQRSHEHLRTHARLIRANLPKPRHESVLFDQLFEHCKELRSKEYVPDDLVVERAQRWGNQLLDDEECAAWMMRIRAMTDE